MRHGIACCPTNRKNIPSSKRSEPQSGLKGFSGLSRTAICHSFLRRARLHLIAAAVGVGLEDARDFVAHVAEDAHFFFFAAFGFGWIEEWPVMAIHLARENRAGLV